MELDNDTLKHCIFSLLTGLGINNVDAFMQRLSPTNCLKLGRAYAQAARDKTVTNTTHFSNTLFSRDMVENALVSIYQEAMGKKMKEDERNDQGE